MIPIKDKYKKSLALHSQASVDIPHNQSTNE